MDPTELLSVVFDSLLPDQWKSSSTAATYVDELSSMGIDRLAREPERLREEKSQILSETRDLAFHNYKTFIETAECSKEVFEDFQSVEGHLDGLLDRLPKFSDSCRALGEVAKDMNSRRRLNSLTLSRHTQLLEILEIPQLMDTCVRNSYYEEALELAAYVRLMKQKFSSIAIVSDIVAEVDASSRFMLQQLLQQLRGPIQLPACLKIIGYLRRQEVFSEVELRLKFLQARDSWFQSQVNAVPTDNAYQHISKVIEICRVYIFDVITQYRAIFSDDTEPLLGAMSSSKEQQAACGVFHSWLVAKVSWFLSVLHADLSAGVGGRLDSLLGQCMYFGLSLGRIGTDFRALLPPLFQEAALSTFQRNIDGALSAFRSALSHYTLASSIVLHAHSTLLSSTLAGTSSSNPGGVSATLAPSQLLEFPPLASLSNGVMSAFNDLRPCAPLAVAPHVVSCLEECLLSVSTGLHSYYVTESSSVTSNETEVFQHLCTAFVQTLVPLVQSSLDKLFPRETLLHAMGHVAADVAADSDVLRSLLLNVERVCAPLKEHLRAPLPAIVDPVVSPAVSASSAKVGSNVMTHVSHAEAPAMRDVQRATAEDSVADSIAVQPVLPAADSEGSEPPSGTPDTPAERDETAQQP